MKKILTISLIAVIILYVGYRMYSMSKDKHAADVINVKVAKVLERDVNITQQAIGTVQPYSSVEIKSMITGQLQKVNFHEGDIVKENELLFEIDPRTFVSALNQAQASLARNQAVMDRDQALLKRNLSLMEKGYTSKQDYETLLSNAKSSSASVKSDQAAIEQANVQLAYTKILAPISGKTGNITLKTGSLIKANDTVPLVTINQVQPIYVSFTLQQQFLPALQKHMQAGEIIVTAQISPTVIEKGKLVFVDNAINTSTGNVELKAAFPNEQMQLWPGQFVNVELTIEKRKNALLIPSLALLTGQKGFYVYIVNKNNIVEVRPVVPGPSVGPDSIIEKGLQVNDVIVTSGQLSVRDGSEVKIN